MASEVVGRVVAAGGRIDSLIHLVGGFAGGRTVEDTDDSVFDRILGLNLRTGFHLLRALGPLRDAPRHRGPRP